MTARSRATRPVLYQFSLTALIAAGCVDKNPEDSGYGEDSGEVAGEFGECWDLNGNGLADPSEDINDDGYLDEEDCQYSWLEPGPFHPGEDPGGIVILPGDEDSGGEPSCDFSGLTAAPFLELPGSNIVGAITSHDGTMYLADQGMSRVIEVEPNGQINELVTGIPGLGSGIAELQQIGWKLYFTETGSASIFVVDLTGSFPVDYASLTPFAQGDFNAPGGLTSDSSGHLYISSLQTEDALGYHSKIDPSGALLDLSWATLEGNWSTLTVDEWDNIYTVESTSITRTSQVPFTSTVLSGLNNPVGLTYQNGCLFFTDDDGVKVQDAPRFTTNGETPFVLYHPEIPPMDPLYRWTVPNPPSLVFDRAALDLDTSEPARILAFKNHQFYFLSANQIWVLQ